MEIVNVWYKFKCVSLKNVMRGHIDYVLLELYCNTVSSEKNSEMIPQFHKDRAIFFKIQICSYSAIFN